MNSAEIALVVIFAGIPTFCFLWIFLVICYHILLSLYWQLPRISLEPPNTQEVDWGITLRPMLIQELAFYTGKPLGTFTPVIVVHTND